jgi:hypothetical protein
MCGLLRLGHITLAHITLYYSIRCYYVIFFITHIYHIMWLYQHMFVSLLPHSVGVRVLLGVLQPPRHLAARLPSVNNITQLYVSECYSALPYDEHIGNGKSTWQQCFGGTKQALYSVLCGFQHWLRELNSIFVAYDGSASVHRKPTLRPAGRHRKCMWGWSTMARYQGSPGQDRD